MLKKNAWKSLGQSSASTFLKKNSLKLLEKKNSYLTIDERWAWKNRTCIFKKKYSSCYGTCEVDNRYQRLCWVSLVRPCIGYWCEELALPTCGKCLCCPTCGKSLCCSRWDHEWSGLLLVLSAFKKAENTWCHLGPPSAPSLLLTAASCRRKTAVEMSAS